MRATLVMPGDSVFRNSIHLALMPASKLVNPVTLPPGRAKFVTKPLLTGSTTTANTIGMIPVLSCNARVDGVLFASRTSGTSAINSAACLSKFWSSPAA